MKHEIKCRNCDLCDEDKAVCRRTGRQVTLDSLRNCKFGIDQGIKERETAK